MSRPEADRNLLFGINALQNDFITRSALIAAMNAWVLEKHRAIGDILVERGDLSPAGKALLDQLLDHHLARHGGDVLTSLAAMSSIESVANDLRRAVDDPDVLESIAQVSTESQTDPHATRAPDTVDYVPPHIRYHKVRDHAEGGLGIVFVARDEELNREVALKEIKPKYADNLASQARFLVEAEITGGLEHPGIVPVYGLGHYDDGRPYYAMRFIRGNSLKDAIKAFHADASLKSEPGARTLALQKLLRRFLDVCNAIAYAHNRGVLHRDLKPDNVMVGKYGETLVVNWGLAKTVGRSGVDDAGSLPESTLHPTSASGSAETIPGSVIGTPGYMSPEQAAGRLDLLGPASDVYGLGATLYTLLTGRVPFSGNDLAEVLRKVERSEFPRPRESTPWLDPALEAIALKAMALKPEARYASPKALADDIERWIADEPVAAYPEPLSRRARRWARKHRTAVTATASILLVTALLIGAYAWLVFDRTRRADATGLATLARAEFLETEARKTSDSGKWSEAIAEARRAEAQLESGGGSESARSHARAKLAELQESLRVVERDRKMVNELDEARLSGASVKDGHFDYEAKAVAILAAFRSYGIDLSNLSPEEAATRIRASRISTELVAALDEAIQSVANAQGERLVAVAHLADTDVRGADIRDRISREDFDGLRRLVAEEAGRRELGPLCRTIFTTLATLDPTASLPVLEAAHRENRADFWLTHELAMACQQAQPPRLESAIRYYHAAAALKPTSPGLFVNLGSSLASKGEIDAAIAAFLQAIRLKPDYAEAHYNLGGGLQAQGQLDLAVAEFRAATRLKPDYAEAHYNLGLALNAQGQVNQAIAEYRAATRIKPDHVEAHYNLGNALSGQGQVNQAIGEYRAAIRLKSDYAEAHNNLGLALYGQGQVNQAIAEYRAAIRLKPDYAEAHSNLGGGLNAQGQVDQAIAEYRVAIRLKPDYAEAHSNLGFTLQAQGQIDQAIVECHAAIRLKPDFAEAHYNLGNALNAQGQIDQAIAEYRVAIRLKPDFAEAHCNLALVLLQMAKFGEALENLEKGHALGSKQPGWRYPSEEWVRNARRMVDLEAKLRAILKGEATPKDSAERLALADVCYKTGRYATSARFWGEAFAETPALADDLAQGHRYNSACSASLAASGQGKDEPMPDDAAKARLRESALGWLRLDLAAWGKILDGGNEPARKQAVAGTLAHWKEDSDLAGIRDEAALAKLPEAEREGFRTLWAEVDRLLAKARTGSP